MLTTVRIENFTVFRKANLEFVPGINVLIGANASGKTHLLKLLYVLQKAQYEYLQVLRHDVVGERLQGVFRPEHIGDLIRKGAKAATVAATWNGMPYEVRLDATMPLSVTSPYHSWPGITEPIFIPVKDMLAHSVGFLSLYNQRYIDFDETYRDILFLAFIPTLRELIPADYSVALDLLAEKLEGTVELQGERFYLTGKSGRYEMHLVAEGWRKLALLYHLIKNGSIFPGTVLYWDEPETNLNPSLMDELVHVLLFMARRGTQIFLATHNYIILKELELQKEKSDSLRMFAMARNEKDGSVTSHAASEYAGLKPNLIAEQFERIYDMEIDRALGGRDANGD
jgi:energy-coupling factor transporter ATP-binding protein EcfA2